MARSRWPLPCLAALRRGFDFDFGDAMWDWERMEGRERSVDEELNVWESQPESRVGRSDMRAEDDEYMDTLGRMSEMALGRSGRARARGESAVSTITGISSPLSPSPSVVVDRSSRARLWRVLAWFDECDVCADELELAMLVELSVAAGSTNDLDLSRPCFWRNLGSFEPCCGLGDGGAGGALRDFLDIVVLVVAVVVVADKDGCCRDRPCRRGLFDLFSHSAKFIHSCCGQHYKIIQPPQSNPPLPVQAG